nr:hypothetical protein [uncultured bacterium]
MPSFRRKFSTMVALTGALLCSSAIADGAGLRAPAGVDLWPRWQARLLTTTSFSLWRHAAIEQVDLEHPRQESLSLLGDFYFAPLSAEKKSLGGFRATSGLIIGPLGSHVLSAFGAGSQLTSSASRRAAYTGGVEAASRASNFESTPYLGLGYTSISPKAGWGFSADIGIAARSAGAAGKFGRVFIGGQALDELMREMRLTPLVNVGVSYSF